MMEIGEATWQVAKERLPGLLDLFTAATSRTTDAMARAFKLLFQVPNLKASSSKTYPEKVPTLGLMEARSLEP